MMLPLIGLIYIGYHDIDLGDWYIWLLFLLWHVGATLVIVYDLILLLQ